MKAVAALPAGGKADEIDAELKRRNAGYTGPLTPEVLDGKIVGLEVAGLKITDISPVAALPDLKRLSIRHKDTPNDWDLPLADLTPLKGMKLTHLDLGGSQVTDLTPLKEMPLEVLRSGDSKVTDFSPLEGMPLKVLRYDLNLERDGRILGSLKSLETLNEKAAAELHK